VLFSLVLVVQDCYVEASDDDYEYGAVTAQELFLVCSSTGGKLVKERMRRHVQYKIQDRGTCEPGTFVGRKSPCTEDTTLHDTWTDVQESITIHAFNVITYTIGSNKSKSNTSCTTEVWFRIIGQPCGEGRGCGVYPRYGEVKRAVCHKFVVCA